tara:strand:- start:183 stop:392 length:210 start_codon:yes stop_codon:yes gene_type:complete
MTTSKTIIAKIKDSGFSNDSELAPILLALESNSVTPFMFTIVSAEVQKRIFEINRTLRAHRKSFIDTLK